MRSDTGRHRSESDRYGLDSALLIAYGVCFVIVIALLPVGGHLRWPEAGPAIGLQALVGLLLAVGPRLGVPRPRYIGLVGIVLYLGSIGLLRDAAPPTSGYGPLALLPVVWASLRGGRGDLPASMIGLAAVYVVPTLALGNSAQYPVGVWRAALLLIVLSVVIGLVVRRLVARVDHLFQRLTDLARTDALTGLPNRRAWQELLEREAAMARRSGRPFTIALIDLDGFKPYNDSHGHLAGDRLLLSITAAWRTALRDTDVLARWGGDEFILLLPACSAPEAGLLLERMRAAFPAAPFSTGVAESDGDRGPETLLAVADEALYRAKRERQGAPATLRADADYESTRPQGPGSPEEEARNPRLEVG
ncbi:MAG TPA: diguanylate cyclase [Solirubrobacteraceae bacterium]|nr:diguanylate cyclase [Solirubrobacteraceae bacterium]